MIVAAALAVGCGGTTHRRSAGPAVPPAIPPRPSAGDYTTIRTAVAVRDDALFHQKDWRRRSATAALGLQTLLTVRVGRGRCAAYVSQLYGNLLDLHEAYAGEDWTPLIRLVRRQPRLSEACGEGALPQV
jgi:hypothetical protein